jgi:hypothetical protein
MLKRRDQTRHARFINLHDAGDGPGAPRFVRRFAANNTEGIHVTAAIAVMQQRRWQVVEVHLFAKMDDLLAGACLNKTRRYSRPRSRQD